MKWHAQAIHVARKDILHSRWLIVAYTIIVVATTLVALDPFLEGPGVVFNAVIIYALGFILVGRVVLDDSPSRVDAFWISQPLHPSAVLAGKLLYVSVILVGIALAGQLVVLVALDVPRGEILPLLGASAAAYLSLLLVGAIFAALTRESKGYLAALVLIPVAAYLLLILVFSAATVSMIEAPGSTQPNHATGTATATTVVLASIALLAFHYQTRRWLASLLAGVVALVLLSSSTPLFIALTTSSRIESGGSALPELRDVKLVLFDTLGAVGSTQFTVRAVVRIEGARADRRYAVTSSEAFVRLPDGNRRPLRIQRSTSVLYDPDVGVGAGIRMIPNMYPVSSQGDFMIVLTTSDSAAIAAGDAVVEVAAVVEFLEPRLLSMPLRAGEGVSRNGRRMTVTLPDPSRAPLHGIRVENVFAGLSRMGGATPEHSERYVLVNRRRSEGFTAFGDGGYGGGTHTLVIPGARAWYSTKFLTYSDGQPNSPPSLVDEDFLRDAELVSIEWVSVGKRLVSTEARVQLPPQRRR